MKINILLILILSSLSSFSQQDTVTVKKNQIDIVGIWNVSINIDKPNAESNDHRKIFQFTSNGIFNVLLGEEGGGASLTPNERGAYVLNNNELEITVNGEMKKGKFVLYSKPYIIKCIILKEEDLLLYNVSGGIFSAEKIENLRMKRR